jgi:polyhydroxyalkanoate synthesis regulator phasin
MGLLIGLVTAPLAPVRAVVWMAETLATHAASHTAQSESLPTRLASVQDAVEDGELSAEEAAMVEEELLTAMLDDAARLAPT